MSPFARRPAARWSLSMLAAGASLLALAPAARAADAASADAGSPLSEVVVTAPRSELKARQLQQDAPNLISVQSAETLTKYPDFNAAESLGRMPGISLSTDTGEGRFINIRGIDGNLDGATFGGVPLLNTYPGGTYFSGGGRAVEFDTVPDGAIDGLVVTYTGLPDHEAEGLGGAVDLTPRSAANITKPFVEGELGGGYEPEHGHYGPTTYQLAMGARFGFDDGHLVAEGLGPEPAPRAGFFSNPTPFSFVVTASDVADRRGFDDIEEDYNNPGTSDRTYQDIQFRNYDYHRVREGLGGEFDFQPNEDHTYYLRANLAGYTESVEKNRLTWSFSSYTPDGTGFSGPAALTINTTDEQETHRNEIYVVGGRDAFGDTVLDYRASYSTASYDQNRNIGSKWKGPTVDSFFDNSANNGDFPVISSPEMAEVNNPALYTLKSISNGAEHDLDQEYAFAANLLFPVHLLNDDDRVKVGAEVRFRNKTQNVFENGGPDGFDMPALSLAGLAGPANTNFYFNGYTNGPNVARGQLRQLVEAAQPPLEFDPTGYFRADEDIYAGYAQYTAKVGKLGILAGVRVEATDASYDNFEFDQNNVNLGFFKNPKDYVNAFPTVQLRYDFTPKLVLRATYSTGIARPGFNQVAGAVTIDRDNGIITTGNPNLKPTTGNNFDLDLEYYMPNGGVIQLDAFDKEFSNYIVTRTSYEASDPRIPGYSTQIQLVSYGNVSSAYARGIQAAYHQKFTFLPGPLAGFGVESNLTLVDSRIEEYDAATTGTVAQYGLLPGTSRMTANLAGFYENYGLEARISAEYVSHELFSLGGSKQNDTIQDNRLTVDFASSYKITGNWSVFFDAKNLTNAPLRFYIGAPSFPVQREFYDVTYEAGIKAKF